MTYTANDWLRTLPGPSPTAERARDRRRRRVVRLRFNRILADARDGVRVPRTGIRRLTVAYAEGDHQ